MNKAVPWSIKGVDFDARTAAKEAARRAGMTLGEWLNSVIAEQAAEEGVDPDEIGEDERVAAVRTRLERMSPAPAAGMRRRGDRLNVAPARAAEFEDEDDDLAFEAAPRGGRRLRAQGFDRQVPYARPRVGDYRDDADDRYAHRAMPGAESLLDEAVRSFERRTRRDNAETSAALDSVARRLEQIEGRLETRRSEPETDRNLKRVISRLESRMEALASREDATTTAPEASRHFSANAPLQAAPQVRAEPAFEPVHVQQPVTVHPIQHPAAQPAPSAMRSSDLARIEAKLNRLLDRETQSPALQPMPMHALQMPAAADQTAYGYASSPQRFEAGIAPSRRPLQDAIAEINRRQADLDRGGPRSASSFAPPRAAQRNAMQAAAFAAAMPENPPAESQSELRTTVTTLKSEIAALSRHIETLRREGAKPDGIAESVREAVASHSFAPELDDLRRQISDMSLAIGKLAPRESLTSLEAAIRKLGEQVTHSRDEGARDNFLVPVEDLIADMRHSLADFAPRSAIVAIEREIQAINRNIETMTHTGVDRESFERACAQTAEIRNLLAAAVARPAPIENIEQQISALTRRMDIIASRGATPVGVSAVNESVGEIRAAMQDAMPAPLLIAIEKRIEDLARKIDEAANRPVPANAQLDTISQRLDAMHETLALQADRAPVASSVNGAPATGHFDAIAKRLDSMQQTLVWQAERQPVAKVDTGMLEGMLQQIMERVNNPAPVSAVMPDLDGFEQSLRNLASRVETISRQPDLDGLSGLEERITSLAVKIESPDFANPSLGEIEHTLNHLASQLEENRLSAIDAASNAARSAARDVLEEFTRSTPGAPASFDGAKELIAREIGGLRSLQDASDRRTHATLGAVHETLEKVVDRLAMLEDEIGERDGASSPAARYQDAHAEEQLTSGPAPVFSRRETVSETQPAAAPEAPAVQSVVRQPAATAPHIPPQGEFRSSGDDFLIEPGSGKRPSRSSPGPAVPSPSAQVAPGAPAEADDANIHGRNSASNFIAAARRAQQAAQAQADISAAEEPQPKRGLKSLAPDSALSEARDRAKAAASLLSGSFRKSAKPEEAEGESQAVAGTPKGRRLFSSRKVLFSLAGLVLVLGALTIIRQNMMRPTPPRPVAATTLPAGPQVSSLPMQKLDTSPTQASAPDAVSRATQFSTENSSSPTVAPTQAAPAPEQRTDRAPVSSIPTFAGTAVATSGNNLKLAASGGDPRAQYELAVRMAEGRLEPRDPASAAQLLEQAAQKGLAPAQYRLGSMYEKGIGVEKNPGVARHWYEQAASAGNVKAMHNFAVLLAEGSDGKPDYVTSANWFKKAAELGVRDSQYNLAILYARGLGIEQSLVDAYVWLALAEAQGDADAGAKRTDVAKRLSPGQLSEATERVSRFRPLRAQAASNEVPAPPGGWSAEATTAQPPALSMPATVNPSNARPQPQKRPKVSSL